MVARDARRCRMVARDARRCRMVARDARRCRMVARDARRCRICFRCSTFPVIRTYVVAGTIGAELTRGESRPSRIVIKRPLLGGLDGERTSGVRSCALMSRFDLLQPLRRPRGFGGFHVEVTERHGWS
jgi:hypothetical protein